MSNLILKDSLFTPPSRGKGYEFPLMGDGQIKIRPFLAADQRFLAAKMASPYEMYFTLLDRIITEPKGHIDELLVSDANATLFACRMMSFGADYNFTYKCESCGSKEVGVIDLSEIEVKYSDDKEEGQAPFDANSNSFKLSDGREINFHVLRLKDEKEVSRFIRDKKRKDPEGVKDGTVEAQYARIASAINDVEGFDEVKNKSLIAKMQFLGELEWSEYDKFVAAIGRADVGIKTDGIFVTCKSCGWENEPGLVLDENFFRSSKR